VLSVKPRRSVFVLLAQRFDGATLLDPGVELAQIRW
jgi:hypothetical protein